MMWFGLALLAFGLVVGFLLTAAVFDLDCLEVALFALGIFCLFCVCVGAVLISQYG